jgi:TetR/AcrR family transcriptional repressor of nem operon
MKQTSRIRDPETTRRKILEAAFGEFFRNGFQGGSLNRVVQVAGTTKGALFHHFAGKQDLGYTVVDEIVGRLLIERWLDPMTDASDPISCIQESFRRCVTADLESGVWLQGCPLNNLAQEMSPLDDGFRERIDRQYETWRRHLVAALERGMSEGAVRKEVDPSKVAALIVSAQMGIWGSGKSSQRKEVMIDALEAIYDYLDSLRP